VTLALAFLLAYAIGLRDWWLLMAGFLGMIPIQTFVLLITVRLFSVEFVPTGEVHDILHLIDSHTADAETVMTDVPRQAPIAIRLWEFFKGINQSRTLEGYALQAGIVVMAVFFAWTCALPLLRAVFPEFDAIRSGLRGFLSRWTLENRRWRSQTNLTRSGRVGRNSETSVSPGRLK
jgi:hypothetical protein